MSFAFTAAGAREHVIDQLRAYKTDNLAGELASRLVADVLAVDDDTPAGEGRQLFYVVKAHGHSGGGAAVSLNLTVESLAVPAPPLSAPR